MNLHKRLQTLSYINSATIKVFIIEDPLFVDNTIADPEVRPSLLMSTTLPLVI